MVIKELEGLLAMFIESKWIGSGAMSGKRVSGRHGCGEVLQYWGESHERRFGIRSKNMARYRWQTQICLVGKKIEQ